MKIKRLTITVIDDGQFLPTIDYGNGIGTYPLETFGSFKEVVEYVKDIDPEFVDKEGEAKKANLTEEEKEKLRKIDGYLRNTIKRLRGSWIDVRIQAYNN